ncbi:MAG TPA: PD-(D/E)XK nuclease family protein [Jiangellaceae bacterium]|nr:PD-(D/E)XK nuclease family protein [Jiangellaceae bacterium]
MRTGQDMHADASASTQADPADADAAAGQQPERSLSPSRATDFMTCPLLYRFRAIDRLPEPPTAAAARGTVVHTVLERLFDLPSTARTPEGARALLEPAWAELLAAEPEVGELFHDDPTGEALRAWLESGAELLDRYFTLEDPQRLEPAEREMYVEATLTSGLQVRGYVDRLDRAPVTGDLRVVDYKTGRAPGPDFEHRPLFQMRFYGLVLWRMHGVIPRLLQLVYLGNGEVLRYEPDEDDLLATERKLAALWAAIERAQRTGEWRARPSKLCDWCAFQSLCPAWGGTPPPLPEQS